ncbi:NAD(+) synthase [Bombella favorum]|uniref:Glutamine-dependent NAD(+) synthetase n=1 Tax=Bombella favorum TaxID=2039164 RepID=A0ABR5ZPN1_9PROT|nr:NAD(+) synthase [Bombella favorum]MBA5726253.1 NAD(+) synthase [Bombella favorum]
MSLADFLCLYRQGFARVAACTTPITLGEPLHNAMVVREWLERCHSQGVAVAVFPELGLTGYTLEDIFFQQVVLEGAQQALLTLVEATADFMTVGIVGLPLRWGDALYNCAAVFHRGRILGIVPKTMLPRYREFYEPRHFTSGQGCSGTIMLGGQAVPFGTDILFKAEDIPGLTLGVEICEDLWVPQPPSGALALAGATVLANLSASPVTVGRAEQRALLCKAQSMRTASAYLYAAASEGESTTDLAWDGQLLIHEAGDCLASSERFVRQGEMVVADIDLDRLRQERLQNGYFGLAGDGGFRHVAFALAPEVKDWGLRRDVPRFPFVPARPELCEQDCREAWGIQVQALCQRLRAAHASTMVIGVSGGLDSALALLVAVKAADCLGWERSRVLARTMPGFATGSESLAMAHGLMASLGVSAGELDIRPTALAMLKAIDHPYGRGEPAHDVTFENVQAGLRTDFLFRLANHHQGLVIGTGDMSELALGWCTYGVGDQMAHYNVNAGLPKTLIQHVIRWAVGHDDSFSVTARTILEKIVSAEISPELVPDQGQGVQSTQQVIGPYPLQDFTLYYVLRHGFAPEKIAFLQFHAWRDAEKGSWPLNYPERDRIGYDLPTIIHWMHLFMKRFFATSQFKRSAMPNGPKVVAGGSLSPRGDWRAPSDGTANLWIAALERLASRIQ